MEENREMLPLPILMLWAKDNWKLIVIGLAIASLAIYIGVLKWQVSHYKELYQDSERVIATANARQNQLEAINESLTRKYDSLLQDHNQTLDKLSKQTKEKIKNDKELNSLRISFNAVRLFNESKRDPTTSTTKTIERDVGKTSTPEVLSITNTVNLSEIFLLVAENDTNHLKCVKQVEAWQGFWLDYSSAVLKIN